MSTSVFRALLIALPFAVAAAAGTVPAYLEANAGQAGPDVLFVGKAAGYSAAITRDGVMLAAGESRIAIQLKGARPAQSVTHSAPASSYSSYLLGNDRAQWRPRVAHYDWVRLHGVYPGVDVVYRPTGDKLEFDFVVAPGADPTQIELLYGGAQQIAAEGDTLAIRTADGLFRQHKPGVYQETRAGQREWLAAAYQVAGDRVRVRTAAHDVRRELVIDPVLEFSSFLGSQGSITSVAADAAGNAYVAGTTNSAAFPVTAGAYQRTFKGGGLTVHVDAFVAKINANGTLAFVTYLGGTGYEGNPVIAVDASGAPLVAVYSLAADFPRTGSLFGFTDTGVYLVQLNATGTQVISSVLLDGTADSSGAGFGVERMVIDARGIYLAGTYTGYHPVVRGFAAPNAPTAAPGSGWGTMLMRMTTATSLDFSSVIDAEPSGLGSSTIRGLAVAADGTAYVGRETRYAGQGVPRQGVLIVSPSGTAATQSQVGGAVVALSGGKGYVGAVLDSRLGSTRGPTDFVIRSLETGEDLYFVQGMASDRLIEMLPAPGGLLYLFGVTDSADFPVTGVNAPLNKGSFFAAKFDPVARGFVWSARLGGTGADVPVAMAASSAGAGVLWLAGSSASTDIPLVNPVNPFPASAPGEQHPFVARVLDDASAVAQVVAKVSATPVSGPAPLAVTFSSAGSADRNNGPLTYRWDFGDGQWSTEANPVHVYVASLGTTATAYSALLTVRNSAGATATARVRVDVVAPPVADSLKFLSPTDGAAIGAQGTEFLLEAITASTVRSIELSVNGQKIGNARFIGGNQYNLFWDTYTLAGTYRISATMTTAAGATLSAALNVVLPAFTASRVAITSPANNAVFTAPARIALTANLFGADPGRVTLTFMQTSGTGFPVTLPTVQSGPGAALWENVPAGTYTVVARLAGQDGRIGVSAPVQIRVNAAAAGGLTGSYFQGTNFTNLKATRVDPVVDFTWGTGAPATGISGAFSVRWEGFLEANNTAEFTFCGTSDDGMKVTVGGEVVVDRWDTPGIRDSCGVKRLRLGERYPIRIEYWNLTAGQARARLRWWSPGQPFEVIPQRYLFSLR